MAEKIYYQDSFIKEFTARIVAVEEKEGQFHVVLDRTAFYPEGGGQPSDRGFIGQHKVSYVYEKSGEVYHILKQMPEKKNKLNCKINWERRFDLMQQHSGQHLLSAILMDMYGVNTVGFHLGDEIVTIDIDRALTEKNFARAEERVNEIIYEDRVIKADYPDLEKLKSMPLRKEPEVDDNIRIVTIEDIDYSPCGGTHLQSTGQIGIVSIINTGNYKGGIRVSFLCGRRALKDYRYKNRIVADTRDILSVNNDKIKSALTKLKEELEQKEKLINDLKDELLDYRAKDLLGRAEKKGEYNIIKNIYTSGDYNDLKYTVDKLIKYDNNIVILGQKEGKTVRLILAKSHNIKELHMGNLLGEMVSLFDGNGGGSEYFAQCGGSISSEEKFTDILNSVYKKIGDKLL